MADPETGGVPLPTFVEHNGWIAESSSRDQPSEDVLLSALTEPTDAVSEDAAAEEMAGAEPAEAEADVSAAADAETTEDDATDAQPRATDGTYAKKESASERKGRIQAEINALTRAKREEERRVETLRRERQQLETKAPAPTPVVETPTPVTEEPTWEAYDASGKTWSDFMKDHSAWIRAEARAEAGREWEARAKADAQKAAEVQQRAADEQIKRAHTERIAKARTEHPDFDEVIESLGQLDETGEPVTPQTPFLRDVVLQHDQGHEVLYYFGKHPEQCKVLADLPLTNSMMAAVRETSSPTALLSYFATNPADVRRLANLPPASALVALGRLTAQVEGAKNGSPTPAPASVTKAKPPIRPVGGSRGAVSEKALEDLPFDQYVRKMNDLERKSRGL